MACRGDCNQGRKPCENLDECTRLQPSDSAWLIGAIALAETVHILLIIMVWEWIR